MRALVVYCHPHPESFTAAVRDAALDVLTEAGAEVTLIDLHAEAFDPVLSRAEWECYSDGPATDSPLARHIEALRAADTLIFVYPTWWYGQPAMLKGWLDRVLLPGVAFHLPPEGDIEPRLRHVRRLAVLTTCGASRWLTWLVGTPGRRIILRGVRLLCAPRVRCLFAAHYAMDESTPRSRARHLDRTQARLQRLLAR